MAYKTKPSTILLRGNDAQFKELPLEPLNIYGVGGITPGMLCVRTSSNTVKPHASATAATTPIFAVENLLLGKGIDDDYDLDGEAVLLVYAERGDEVYALLEAGSGNDAVIGDLLESNGAGLLQKGSTGPIARALEHIDNDPGTNSLPMRIRVEVM